MKTDAGRNPDEKHGLTEPGLDFWLDEIARQSQVGLDSQAHSRLLALARLLRNWNTKMNLTAITGDSDIAVRHYLDSLTLIPHLDRYQAAASGPLRLIDVGTGAGFPGLVIAIARPQWQVMLLDSLAKRIRYLDAVISELSLSQVETLHSRAEDAARTAAWREQYDIAVARAVANLPVLAEYCLPFVRVGGCFLAMKGDITDEWPAARRSVQIMGAKPAVIHTFNLPGTEMKRTILEFKKIRSSPPAYPRKAGTPEKNPL